MMFRSRLLCHHPSWVNQLCAQTCQNPTVHPTPRRPPRGTSLALHQHRPSASVSTQILRRPSSQSPVSQSRPMIPQWSASVDTRALTSTVGLCTCIAGQHRLPLTHESCIRSFSMSYRKNCNTRSNLLGEEYSGLISENNLWNYSSRRYPACYSQTYPHRQTATLSPQTLRAFSTTTNADVDLSHPLLSQYLESLCERYVRAEGALGGAGDSGERAAAGHTLQRVRGVVDAYRAHKVKRQERDELNDIIEGEYNLTPPGIMSENIGMCKIAYFCMVLCAVLTTSMRNCYISNKYKIINAKIAHSL